MNGQDPVNVPIDGTLDLHTFSPSDCKSLVREYLSECLQLGILDVRIIHGKGTGALRRTVHATLNTIPFVVDYHLAKEGNWGATVVRLDPAAKKT
jgi:DNA-nicking Smr family endonuclease